MENVQADWAKRRGRPYMDLFSQPCEQIWLVSHLQPHTTAILAGSMANFSLDSHTDHAQGWVAMKWLKIWAEKLFLTPFYAISGRTLWELYSVQVFMLQRDFQIKKTVSKTEFKEGLKSQIQVLEEARRCLEWSRDPFESKVFELSGKALASCKETLNFIDFM